MLIAQTLVCPLDGAARTICSGFGGIPCRMTSEARRPRRAGRPLGLRGHAVQPGLAIKMPTFCSMETSRIKSSTAESAGNAEKNISGGKKRRRKYYSRFSFIRPLSQRAVGANLFGGRFFIFF